MKDEYVKDFDAWNEYAKKLERVDFSGFFRAREMWWCSLGTNIGGEQDGKNKSFERPVLVLRRMRHDLALVVPLTSRISEHPDRVLIKIGLDEYQILLSQVKTVSCKRLLRRAGYAKIEIFKTVVLKLGLMILQAYEENETPPGRRGISEPEGIVREL